MQIDPKQIARKLFIAFFCSNRYMEEHTKSRQNSGSQKGFIKDLKENRLYLHVLQLVSIVLHRFIRETYLYSSIYILLLHFNYG